MEQGGEAGVLYDPLAITGIFLIGASSGALVTYARCKPVLDQGSKILDILEGCRTTEPHAHLGLKALIVGHDAEMISIFSALFREKGIETRKFFLESAALDQLASEKFEALILDFDDIADCRTILHNLPRPNEKVLVIAVASDDEKKEAASRAGATFIIERPLLPARLREAVRVAYGRMLRDGQHYFRLAVALPVSIRAASGMLRQCVTLNLSQSGMAVSGSCSFIVGEPVSLTFAIPNTEVVVSAEGKIIWDDKHGKTGISFECVNASAQSRYYEWLHDHFFMRQSDNSSAETPERIVHAG